MLPNYYQIIYYGKEDETILTQITKKISFIKNRR
jgi:hypothetical protein